MRTIRYYEPGIKVGEHRELGRFGGVYCNRYRVDAVDGGHAILVPIVARSVKNSDGTFSTVYEDAR